MRMDGDKMSRQIIPFPEKSFPLVVREVSGEFSEFAAIATHFHPEIELQYIFAGGGKYYIKNTIYPLKKGTLLIIKSNEIHRYVPNLKSPWIRKISIIFSPRLFKHFSSYLRNNIPISKFRHSFLFSQEEITVIEIILKNILRESTERNRNYRAIILFQLSHLLLTCQRNELPFRSKIVLSEKQDKVIKTIFSYLDSHFNSKITVNYLSNVVNLSPNYLSYLFKKITGIRLKEYLLQKRIAEAKIILEKEPQKKIIEISGDVGFDDLSSFNRAFKRINGFSPSQYRSFCILNRRKIRDF